ncbi:MULTISPECIES: hypothetical protein [Thalassospira]|uniref:Uncharacterized protein n=2 Tax=Thalassospira tepidiphila TaxID=393657 RepID=A0A853L1I6_9PROT|nr:MULTISPECIES: hypothetical protein [Thalassospira]NJB73369.1 hypothetical protein [Thalassospira tepidiphila]MBE71339.1 hypothetical protein [Thalassospira sp.]MBO6578066.1 hypothetical protein [Thalassospira sp.]MBO6817786.1 hypothetical protein [Thalassospira sp.]MBO6886889.1 hypothetical protein [Thalassospira sp.]
MARKTSKPEFLPKGIGVETAGPARELSDDMKLATRKGKKQKDRRNANGGGWRSFFSVTAWLRFILTFGTFGLIVHGLFVVFGIYERNQRLANFDHFVLLIKLVVFVALMYLFYAMLMHYGPIRHKVRGIFFLALAPVAALCIFMIYGGGQIFGSFLPVLQFLTLTVGVGGFLLYILGYTWITGRKVKREAAKHGDPAQVVNDGDAAGDRTLPPLVQGDRRRQNTAGNLRLRRTDGGDGPARGSARRKIELPDV